MASWDLASRNPTTGIAGCCARASGHAAAAPPSSVMTSRRLIRSPHRPRSLWQTTKHEDDTCPVGSAQANATEVFGVEPEDFPAAKQMRECSVDREPKCRIASRQHYCKRL